MWLAFEHSKPAAARLQAALASPQPRVHFYSPELESRRYLTSLAADDFQVGGRSWRITEGSQLPDRVDVLLLTSNAADLLAPIWNLRRQLPDAVCLVWLWDNHHDFLNNLRVALAVDGYFPSHAFNIDYLMNPHSANFGHLPLCCGQWSAAEIAAALAVPRRRSDRFLAAYVDYDISPRGGFLRRLRDLPEAALRLMSVPEWNQYFGRSKADQLAEWCAYKTSLVVPVDRDLSLRLFDGLACGQIPIASDAIIDLDAVISPALQAMLPVLRYRDGDLDSLRAAHAEALRRFDAEGEAGIRRRHDYVVSGHLVQHRVAAMLSVLAALGEGQSGMVYHTPNGGLSVQSLRAAEPAAASMNSSRAAP